MDMAGTMPDLVCCPDPCASPTTVQVPGPSGAAGAGGADGAAGAAAYTTFTAAFVMPAEGGSDVATLGNTSWMSVNQIVYAAKVDGSVIGTFQVTAIGGATSATLKNLKNTGAGQYTANSAPGAIFTIGSKIGASGYQGPVASVAGSAIAGAITGTIGATKLTRNSALGALPVGDGVEAQSLAKGTDGQILASDSAGALDLVWKDLIPKTAGTNVSQNRIPRLSATAGLPIPLEASQAQINAPGSVAAGLKGAVVLDASAGNARGTDAVDLQVNRAVVTQVASGNRSFIGSGEKNSAIGTECSVVGGDTNTAGAAGGANDHAFVGGGNDNSATGEASVVGGGDTNVASAQESVCVGGNHNTANAVQSTVAGGDTNTASGVESSIGGGGNNVASGLDSVVAGGDTSGSTGPYSCVPGGKNALADKHGQFAHSAGGFGSVPGTAQESILVMRNATTDATPTELFLDGTSLRAVMASGVSWMFQIMLVARKDNGLTSIYKSEGLITNVGNVVTMPAAATTTEIYDGIGLPATPVAVTNDDPNNALIITCTGIAATNVRWVARVALVEVLY